MDGGSVEVERDDAEITEVDLEPIVRSTVDRTGERAGQDRLSGLERDADASESVGEPHDTHDRIVQHAGTEPKIKFYLETVVEIGGDIDEAKGIFRDKWGVIRAFGPESTPAPRPTPALEASREGNEGSGAARTSSRAARSSSVRRARSRCGATA